jgi:hypothetical protein
MPGARSLVMALPSARRLREHVRDLAKEMGVTVVYVGDQGEKAVVWGQALQHPYFMQRDRRIILLSHRPITPMTYMVAMHELGHCVPGAGWSADLMLDREAGAWEWALANSILPAALASHHARQCMIDYRAADRLARSERFERLYRKVTRLSRPYRQRKR